MEKINPQLFKSMLEAGAVKTITVVADGPDFNVIIHVGRLRSPLTTFRGNVRAFKTIHTVLSFLHGFGVGQFEVDIRHYAPKT